MSVNGALPLSDVRARIAEVLAPASEGDPEVFADLVDAVSPPVVLVVWDDPWLTLRTVGPGFYEAHVTALCLAARIEPGPGIDALDRLVDYVIGRLEADAYSWPLERSQAPRVFEFAGLHYLGARLTFRAPVSIGGSS